MSPTSVPTQHGGVLYHRWQHFFGWDWTAISVYTSDITRWMWTHPPSPPTTIPHTRLRPPRLAFIMLRIGAYGTKVGSAARRSRTSLRKNGQVTRSQNPCRNRAVRKVFPHGCGALLANLLDHENVKCALRSAPLNGLARARGVAAFPRCVRIPRRKR